MSPVPHPTTPDWPLRAPVENPTGADITARRVMSGDAVPWNPVRSGAVRDPGGLTLSEATADPTLAAVLAALDKIGRDLNQYGIAALTAGAAAGDAALERAGGRLFSLAADVDDVRLRLASRGPADDVDLEAPPYLADGTPNPNWPPSYRVIAERARRRALALEVMSFDAEGTLLEDHGLPLISIAPMTELERRARDGDR